MSYSRYTFPESQIMCPYDNSHVLGNLKAYVHLTKCRQKHPHLAERILICPYNQSHHIAQPEMKYHFTVCQEYKASQNYNTMTCNANVSGRVQVESNATSEKNKVSRQQVEEDVSEWM